MRTFRVISDGHNMAGHQNILMIAKRYHTHAYLLMREHRPDGRLGRVRGQYVTHSSANDGAESFL